MALVATVVTACGDSHKDGPTPPAPPVKEVARTLVVYMVANNDLGQRGWDDADISEMRAAAASGGLADGRLVVMHQSPEGVSVLKEINAGGGVDTLRMYDNSDPSVSIARMKRVLDDVREFAPARDYALVLWSHGTGWLQDGMHEPSVNKAFGLDGTRQMNVTSLAEALKGQNLSFVYFDCCLMASVEVAYELRHATPLIAASATELPNAGMPYDENISMLIQGRLADAASNTFRYYNEMSGSGRTCTMSVIDTRGLDRLADATRRLYATAKPLPTGTMPQPFERGTCRHYDLAHYAELIASDSEALADWQEALDKTVVYANATPKIFNTLNIYRHCGLSTNAVTSPDDMDTRGYSSLQWASDVASALPWAK